MTFTEIIEARRSIRTYQDKPVDSSLLEQIAEAGRKAPSSLNRQEWRFIAIADPALRAQMIEACKGQPSVTEAPVIFAAVCTAERIMPCGQSAATVDCSIAMDYMMLKATELGLGTCWLGAYSQEAVKSILGLGEQDIVVALMPVGYAAEEPAARPRKALSEVFEIR